MKKLVTNPDFIIIGLTVLLITLISILVISLTHTGLLFYSQYLVFLYFLISLSRNKEISFSEILIIAIYLLVLFLFLLQL